MKRRQPNLGIRFCIYLYDQTVYAEIDPADYGFDDPNEMLKQLDSITDGWHLCDDAEFIRSMWKEPSFGTSERTDDGRWIRYWSVPDK